MGHTESLLLRTPGPTGEAELAEAVAIVRAAGLSCTVRRSAGSAWIGIEQTPVIPADPHVPLSPGWFDALIRGRAERWAALASLAQRVSGRWAGDVVTLEGAPEMHWVRYSRHLAGRRVRCFEYSANDVTRAGWIQNEGEAESWEDDEEVGPDMGAIARQLGVPGLGAMGGPALLWTEARSVGV